MNLYRSGVSPDNQLAMAMVLVLEKLPGKGPNLVPELLDSPLCE